MFLREKFLSKMVFSFGTGTPAATTAASTGSTFAFGTPKTASSGNGRIFYFNCIFYFFFQMNFCVGKFSSFC